MNFRLTCVALLTASTLLFSESKLELVRNAIQTSGAQWTAGESWVSQLSDAEFARLCGAALTPPTDAPSRLITLRSVGQLPSHLDWRDNNGDWVTAVKNQSACGSCWDFSATAQVETWWQIYNADPDSNIDLSEQFVLSCSGAGSCDGGGVEAALTFYQQNGVPLESCMPYQVDDGVPCSDACLDWQQQAVSIPGWGYVTLEESIVDNIKQAVLRHPVSVSYTVYEDFRAYTGGVYEHVLGVSVGGHAVLIVGWDDANECWIVKNSWGPNWGENGYFRIKWGDSGMGAYVPFIYDALTANALSLSMDEISATLTAGDSIVEYLTLRNHGADDVQFSLIDYEVPMVFHPDSFNSFDGSSWWCGDPAVGGYLNHWLQYLDSPLLDLSETRSAELSFQAFWVIEDPAGATPPWDGWDGANVWVSTDSGQTFQVINPIEPLYSSQSLWSFGDADQGWNMGVDIPGWAGASDGWISARFDLSGVKSDQAIIRFAFASDMGFCTEDDDSVVGFFVDDIKISDGDSILFLDDADNLNAMHRRGFGAKAADWLGLEGGDGLLAPGDSFRTSITLSAKDLAPGDYEGLIKVSSNDSSVDLQTKVHLSVLTPQVDVAVKNVAVPAVVRLLSPLTARAKIENRGRMRVENFDVICDMSRAEDSFFADTLHIVSLDPDSSLHAVFRAGAALDTGLVDIVIRLENVAGDAVTPNNHVEQHISVTNLLDDFENGDALWAMQGGWGVTDKHGSHTGDFAVHVNGGKVPYAKDMNATMNWKQALPLAGLDSLAVAYWAWIYTEEGHDNCYLKVSTDSLSWTAVDTMSGAAPTFQMRRIDLTPFLSMGADSLWLRFQFVSDDENELVGVFIDDLRLYPHKGHRVPTKAVDANRPPKGWALLQNYPNPFNPTTTIRYNIMKPAQVRVSIYNLNGRLVETILDDAQAPGAHRVNWNAAAYASGLYFYKLEATTEYGERFQALNKMLLVH